MVKPRPQFSRHFGIVTVFLLGSVVISFAQKLPSPTPVWSVGPLAKGEPVMGIAFGAKGATFSGPRVDSQTGSIFLATRSIAFAGDRYYSRRAEEGPNGREWRVSRAISGATSGRKANLVGLPDVSRSEAPRDVYEGTESFSGDAQYRKPGYSHLAQPAEPPYADPHVRWGGGEDG